ncbi:MAG: hypothetical protein AUI14_06120 [Actinobacteria bacterium 13_2_20CM_2_71_6]|nr:MAG: hypothetical protein AUI14_06120 [Actinobacteria bacterium 13_2_20CM_2_71_6]
MADNDATVRIPAWNRFGTATPRLAGWLNPAGAARRSRPYRPRHRLPRTRGAVPPPPATEPSGPVEPAPVGSEGGTA